MSLPWIPCSRLQDDFSLYEILKFITNGWLTPYDENERPILPEKFLEAQEKANALGPDRSFDDVRKGIEKAFERIREEYLNGKNPIPFGFALEEVLAQTDKEKSRRISELLELERFLAEHSQYPWQTLEFTGHDYEIESIRIAKAFFKEAEVNAFKNAIGAAKGAPATETTHSIGFKVPSGSRKTDYRTEQWEKAIPIAKGLYEKNRAITLGEIKSDPTFKACFEKSGMPGDSELRRKLNDAGIKLIGGKRKKRTP